uniref:Putative 8.9 kDa secreted protein n=1 Tax=Ixodes ricinus TaxID=34613 RepID=A0A090XC78_IXORI
MRTIVLLAVIALGGVSLIMGGTNRRHHYGVSFDNGNNRQSNRQIQKQLRKNRKVFKQLTSYLSRINRTLAMLTVKDNLTVRRVDEMVQERLSGKLDNPEVQQI